MWFLVCVYVCACVMCKCLLCVVCLYSCVYACVVCMKNDLILWYSTPTNTHTHTHTLHHTHITHTHKHTPPTRTHTHTQIHSDDHIFATNDARCSVGKFGFRFENLGFIVWSCWEWLSYSCDACVESVDQLGVYVCMCVLYGCFYLASVLGFIGLTTYMYTHTHTQSHTHTHTHNTHFTDCQTKENSRGIEKTCKTSATCGLVRYWCK